MPERIVTTTNFWEQESAAPHHHLHAPVDEAAPRIIIVETGEERSKHDGKSFWHQTDGELLKRWMCVTAGDIQQPGSVRLLHPLKEAAVEGLGISKAGLLRQFPDVRLIVLLGAEAHRAVLRGRNKATLEETIRAYDEFLPFFPLPHPSAAKHEWLKNHPWFEQTILQILRRCVALALEKNKL